jgi:D-alanyl-D-alanine carboxypeptidase
MHDLHERRRGRWSLLVWSVALIWNAAAHAGLSQDIERAVRSTDLGGATVGVSVRDAVSGRSLAVMNADKPLIPASNL